MCALLKTYHILVSFPVLISAIAVIINLIQFNCVETFCAMYYKSSMIDEV